MSRDTLIGIVVAAGFLGLVGYVGYQRWGKPASLFWMWAGGVWNVEFVTYGALAVIVFGLSFLLAFGVKSLVGPVEDDSSRLHTITGVIGPSVSGVFLWVLGVLNLAALLGILKVFRNMRRGQDG